MAMTALELVEVVSKYVDGMGHVSGIQTELRDKSGRQDEIEKELLQLVGEIQKLGEMVPPELGVLINRWYALVKETRGLGEQITEDMAYRQGKLDVFRYMVEQASQDT